MPGQYVINYTNPANGSFIIYPHEINGAGNQSTPRPIVGVNTTLEHFKILGNFIYRFTAGFNFTVQNSTGNNGAWNVAADYPITGVVSGLNGQFSIATDLTSLFAAGNIFTVIGSTGNDGSWTVLSSSFALGTTTITITGTLPSAVADGSIMPSTYIVSTNETIIPVTGNITSAVVDGEIVYSAEENTSLLLPGRGTLNYGETLLENLVHQLENFSHTAAPANPIEGQLWYDSTAPDLKVYDGATWNALIFGSTSAIPITEIVFGTGTGITSSPTLTYDTTTGAFALTPAANATPSAIVITSASASVASAATGADIQLTAGSGDGAGSGGEISLTAGNTSTGSPGPIAIYAGNGDVDGGSVTIVGGNATVGGAGTGGLILIQAGIGTDNVGGTLTLQGGAGALNLAAGAAGGDLEIQGGNGAGTGKGGNVNITPGTTGTGTFGAIFLNTPSTYVAQAMAVGTAESRQYMLGTSTTNGTITEMFLDGAGGTKRLNLTDNQTWYFEIKVMARRTDASGESAAYKYEGAIDRATGVATTALVGTVIETILAEDTAAWAVTVDADTTNGSLRIQVTGEVGKTIKWLAFVRTIEG